MLKPFVLIPTHDEYTEALTQYHSMKSEFSNESSVVLIRINPAQEDNEHLIDHVLYYSSNNNSKISYKDSINVGLKFVKKNYHNAYCLLQHNEIMMNQGSYKEIDYHMQNGCNAVLFQDNKYACYTTKCFAVSMNEDYWPPTSNKSSFDIFERQWWLEIGKEPINTKVYLKHQHLFKDKLHANSSI